MFMKKYMLMTAAAAFMLSGAPAMADDHGKMKMMEGKHKAGAHGMMMKADANDDGVISKDEFMTFHEEKFQSFDKDGDGNVTKEEMTSYREEKREKMRDAHFDEADTDKDGKLSKDEMEAHKEKMQDKGRKKWGDKAMDKDEK